MCVCTRHVHGGMYLAPLYTSCDGMPSNNAEERAGSLFSYKGHTRQGLCSGVVGLPTDPRAMKSDDVNEVLTSLILENSEGVLPTTLPGEDVDIVTKSNAQNVSYNLWLAALNGKLAECKKLVGEGASPNYQNLDALATTPLMVAAGNPNKSAYAIAKYLLTECSADPNKQSVQGKSAMHSAARLGNTELVRLLLRNGGDPSIASKVHGNMPAHLAASHGKMETLISFFSAGKRLPINLTNAAGNTCLHCAAEGGHTKTVEVLLEYGALPNLRNQTKSTPLQTAVQHNHVGPALLLMKRSDEQATNNQDHHGKTALHYAAVNNNLRLVNLILKNNGKPSVNLPDHAGEVPLHGAVRNKCAEACALLFKEYGANATVRNLSGESPYSLALIQKNSSYQKCYDQLVMSITDRRTLEQDAAAISLKPRDNFVIENRAQKEVLTMKELSPEQQRKKDEKRKGIFSSHVKKSEEARRRQNLFVASAADGLKGTYYVVG